MGVSRAGQKAALTVDLSAFGMVELWVWWLVVRMDEWAVMLGGLWVY